MSAEIVLVTEDRYEGATATNWYLGNILQDDELVAAGFAKHGISTERVSWSRKGYDWSAARAAVFRTTWDYFERFGEFMSWIDVAAKQTKLLNTADQVRWNADKHYLADLERWGVSIPTTRFVEPGAKTSLAALFQETGFEEAVLKPAVSGAAWNTFRMKAADAAQHEEVFQSLLEKQSWMLQPFLQNVAEGELSLVVIGGRYSHAIKKVPKPGDFRVQDDHGGKASPYTPSRAEIAFAERAVSVCRPEPIYGRVDVVYDNNGRLVVMELELIEPELWFRLHPPSAQAFADAVVARL